VEELSLKWDLIKMEIRGFTIKYSKNKAKKRKSAETYFQNKINELDCYENCLVLLRTLRNIP